MIVPEPGYGQPVGDAAPESRQYWASLVLTVDEHTDVIDHLALS
jgi:hypothetical protein